MKASYTVEMNGHPGPSTAFFTPGSGMPPAGGEISKSTQNLISAMEEVPALALALALAHALPHPPLPHPSLPSPPPSRRVKVKRYYVTVKSLS